MCSITSIGSSLDITAPSTRQMLGCLNFAMHRISSKNARIACLRVLARSNDRGNEVMKPTKPWGLADDDGASCLESAGDERTPILRLFIETRDKTTETSSNGSMESSPTSGCCSVALSADAASSCFCEELVRLHDRDRAMITCGFLKEEVAPPLAPLLTDFIDPPASLSLVGSVGDTSCATPFVDLCWELSVTDSLAFVGPSRFRVRIRESLAVLIWFIRLSFSKG
mmetsp:Transcript_39080/g.97858  ORF Transcript_39080/g.97858 Transcript_39080/m.97858 type:complete len:226 (-) Transcript_39080:911-1588(-)